MILDKIVASTRERIKKERKERPTQVLLNEVRAKRPVTDFREAFVAAASAVNIIAEIKRSSPALGDLNLTVSPTELAKAYLENGAKALSVLTEPEFFKGDLNFLSAIREENPKALLLMKDFFLDEYQFLQARVAGANATLLIARLLEPKRLSDFVTFSRELGMTPLVEVHNEPEMEVAIECEAPLIGINNRDLDTMKIDLRTSHRLAQMAPKGTILISESGIEKAEDIKALREAGFRGFLIGTSFMRTPKPGDALADLLKECR